MKWWHISVIIGLIIGFSAVGLNKHFTSEKAEVVVTAVDVDARLTQLKSPVVIVGVQDAIGGADIKVVDGNGVFYTFFDSALRSAKPGYKLK